MGKTHGKQLEVLVNKLSVPLSYAATQIYGTRAIKIIFFTKSVITLGFFALNFEIKQRYLPISYTALSAKYFFLIAGSIKKFQTIFMTWLKNLVKKRTVQLSSPGNQICIVYNPYRYSNCVIT